MPLNVRVDLPWSGARPSTITVVSATIDGSRSCPAPSFELSSEVWPPLPEPSLFIPPDVGTNVTSRSLRQSSVAILSPLQDSVDWEVRRQRHLTAVIRVQTAARSWIAKLSFEHVRTAIISLQTAVRGWLARAKLAVMAEEFGMACLASPLRHSTERRIPPFSQGHPYFRTGPCLAERRPCLTVCLLCSVLCLV